MEPDNQPKYFDNNQNQPDNTASAPTDLPTEMYAPTDDSEPSSPQTDSPSDNTNVDTDEGTVHWSATEYIYREKGGLWFLVFAVVVLGLIAADILFLKSYTFSVLVAVMALAVVIYSKRPPAEINYTLSPAHGLYIGEKLRTFNEFRAFGVVTDHGTNYVMLIPVKRFSLGTSVYFPTEVGEKVVDLLGSVLPMETIKPDIIDFVVRKLRL